MSSGRESGSDSDSGSEEHWCEGEKCIAPYSDQGTLCEAEIKQLFPKEGTALVKFPCLRERNVSIKQLSKIKDYQGERRFLLDVENEEKPFFHDKNLPSPAVPYKLSENGPSIPYTINRYLRDYQREGVMFIYNHYIQGKGCILGDDMGLGKTIQVISFLAAALQKKGTRKDIENFVPEFLLTQRPESGCENKKLFLIVAPLSVLYNWKDEFDTWGYFKGTILHGNKKEEEFARVKRGKFEYALTTYETLRLYLDDFNRIEWSAVIVDEVHRIKNPNSQITVAMKALQCKIRIGLTGTILQNNMEELWCVVDWAVPGCLGSLNWFKSNFSDPVENGQRHNVSKRGLALGRRAVYKLAKKLSCWFLRRTKSLISSQLPKKDDKVVYCALTEFQQAVYKAVLDCEDVSLVLRSWDPCSCNSGRQRKKCCFKTNKDGIPVHTLYLSYLTVLRKVANHVALLQPKEGISKMQVKYIKEVCMQVFSTFPEFIQQSDHSAFEIISDPKYSGKMKVLKHLLERCIRNKDKLLLFSFSTMLLDVIERFCMAEGIEYRRLDGNTKSKERIALVKEFNTSRDINICLVSTMAGGLGLNFVGANIVVLFDPTWNPASDLQAIDRAYRIGQCRDVKVFRLISLGTVEEIIYLRQVYKQQLQCAVIGRENAKRYFDAVQGSDDHRGELFGIKNFFQFSTSGTCLTRNILQRDGQVEAGILTAVTQMRDESLAQGQKTTSALEDNPERRQCAQKATNNFPKEILDFSSDSEEEQKGSKYRTEKNETSGLLSLIQCGLSEFLDAKIALEYSYKEENESSETQSSSENNILPTDKKKKITGQSSDLNLKPVNMIQSANHRPKSIKNYSCVDCEESHSSPSKASSVSSRTNFNTNRKRKNKTCRKLTSELTEKIKNEAKIKLSSRGHPGLLSCKPRKHKSTVDTLQHLNKNLEMKTAKMCNITESDSGEESDYVAMSKKEKITHSKAKLREPGAKQCMSLSQEPKRNVAFNVCEKGPETDWQMISSFSSEEEDISVKKVQFCKAKRKRKQCYVSSRSSFKNKEIFIQKEEHNQAAEKQGSLDSFLDGVQGVVYTHSNQHIVGSSKAENQMSRSALRDVFELNQYTQMPANLVHSDAEENFPEQPAKTHTKKNISQEITSGTELVHLEHPVINTERKVHRSGRTTFLIGETPPAIRRKHISEMTAFFKKSSVKQLAEQILTTTSESRQHMLKDFYCHHYPDIDDILTVIPPMPLTDIKHESSGPSTSHSPCNKTTPHVKDSSEPVQGMSLKHFKNVSKNNPRDSEKISNIPKDSEDFSCIIPENFFSCYNEESLSTVKSKNDSHTHLLANPSEKNEPLEVSNSSTENPDSQKELLAGLLGDTSVLDDVFNPKISVEPQTSSASSHTAKVKKKSKDLWDILNEDDEDSVNILTDMSVVERICEDRNIASKVRKDSQSPIDLWKKNENFIWKM
uniref:Excision repair cross-complementation group 6-like 2 n=1 Tax=Erpetoichthys calabaricus TaxID=27687 RepID=A0A8C4RZX1_ERPCA